MTLDFWFPFVYITKVEITGGPLFSYPYSNTNHLTPSLPRLYSTILCFCLFLLLPDNSLILTTSEGMGMELPTGAWEGHLRPYHWRRWLLLQPPQLPINPMREQCSASPFYFCDRKLIGSVLGRQCQQFGVHECFSCVMHIRTVFHNPFSHCLALIFFLSLLHDFPWPWEGNMGVLLSAQHSTITSSQYLSQSWDSALTAVHSKETFLWSKLRTVLAFG